MSHLVGQLHQASTWENYRMDKEVEMGWAGSLTVSILCISVALLLRSFYKRYSKMKDREDNGGL
jgi:NADH:ubiquinone oxidoreductase subunit H